MAFRRITLLATGVLSALAPVCLAFAQEAEPPIPQAHPASRYQRIWENSPFELEAPPPTGPAGPGFADHLTLVGITKVKGITVVTLLDKQSAKSFDLREGETKDSFRIVEVSPQRDPSQTLVKLTNGQETATVGYDKKLLATSPVRPTPTPPPPSPNSVLNRTPENPTPQVARRRIIPSTAQPPGTNPPGAAPVPGSSPTLIAPASGDPDLPQLRSAPTPETRRQIVLPQPRTP